MKPHDDQRLEQFLDQTLLNLPDRPAPHSLEMRVLNQIAARQSLPWWRKSFSDWPFVVRTAFLALSVVIAASTILLGYLDTTELRTFFSEAILPLKRAHEVFATLTGAGMAVCRSIPALWFYGVIAFLAAMYAALFGIGATAYRALLSNR